MKKETRKQEEIINDIRDMVKSPGYIVALCMTLFEDHHIFIEEADRVNVRERLSTKEASFLISQFLQIETLISDPNSPEDILEYKNKTSELFKELHLSYITPYTEKLSALMVDRANGIESDDVPYRTAMQDFFGDAQLFKEAITYSGTGVYDIQFLDFLEKKYRYDKDWLISNKQFDFDEVKRIVLKIKDIHFVKSQKVHFIGLKENRDKIVKETKTEGKGRFGEKSVLKMMNPIEFYQYRELFGHIKSDADPSELDNLRAQGWKSFYTGILDLFTINKSDFDEFENADTFFETFSFVPGVDSTNSVNSMESRNIFNYKPMIKLDDDRYFVPMNFLLTESVYESPFYWMGEDNSYKNQLGKNRGRASEEIVFDFLSTVFGTKNTYDSIIVRSEKGKTDTDIDILCVLGNKALCVQVKSKKLTHLARTGDDDQLFKDFKGAVQDAYDQGLICREKIIEKSARFFEANGNEIEFADQIDEVYVMVVTSENYPALTHQSYVLLNKNESDPFPITLTIFDLQLLTHYLRDPYDFLYYIRQRISLMGYINGSEEITFLAHHLTHKLGKHPKADYVGLDNDLGLMIDRNYYCHLYGVEGAITEKDKIRTSWINDEFQEICNAIKEFKHPKITDVIFDIFDYPAETRDQMVKMIKRSKNTTLTDYESHNFSIVIDNPNSGITYVSHGTDSPHELRKDIECLTAARKYRHKCDKWIGLGNYFSSTGRIDIVAYHDYEWVNDPNMEEASNRALEHSGIMTTFSGQKVGRNDPCPCNSGKKYKKCCGIKS